MRRYYILIILIVSLFVVSIGASYAFFWATSTPGSITASGAARLLGNIDFVDGQSVVTPVDGIFPGWIGVQRFNINKPSGVNEGVGTYEIVMETSVDVAYSDWVSYEVYKTTNSGDTIVRAPGALDSNADNSNEIFVTDSLDVTGFNIPSDAISSGVINSTSGIISLDKENFYLATWEDTTYYIVYRFHEVDINQNAAQGKSFNTIIDVNLVEYIEEDETKYVNVSGAYTVGESYVKTNYVPSSNSRIDISYTLLEAPTDTLWVFSSRQSYLNSMFGIAINSNEHLLQYYNQSSNLTSKFSSDIVFGTNIRHNASISTDGLFYTNGENPPVVGVDSSLFGVPQTTWTSSYGLVLFANNNSNTIIGFTNGKVIIHSFVVYESEIKVMDVVPVILQSGEVVMYDLISDSSLETIGTLESVD